MRFAARDITLRYRQTALGAIWVILVPLLGRGHPDLRVRRGGRPAQPAPDVPYFVFTLAGMVAWTTFSQVTNRSSASLVGNASLVGKVYFPRLLLPISTVLSTMVDAAVSLALLIVLLLHQRGAARARRHHVPALVPDGRGPRAWASAWPPGR